MIERVYLKNHLSFDEVELHFSEVELNLSRGLMIFTGPSGAGKSVLLQGILAIFAYVEANAQMSEATIDEHIDLSEFGIDVESEIIFKQIKKEKTRYFINNQAVSKKVAKQVADNFIDYLSLRNANEFANENLLEIIDKFANNDLTHYTELFTKYTQIQKELLQISAKEKEVHELREFLEFEINKIEQLAPKPNEFEELMDIKKSLSKIEKLKELSFMASEIFKSEHKVAEFLAELEVDSGFFDEAMNELRHYVELAQEKAEFLENVDIDEVLERLSQLQALIQRFGSIPEALDYVQQKKLELDELNNLSFHKEALQKEQDSLLQHLQQQAKSISAKRKKAAELFAKKLNHFLKKLYMPQAQIILSTKEIDKYGIDKAEIKLDDVDINNISTGEFNRLRLALLASKIEYDNKPKSLFLDEIDANLSGEESMSVAEVLQLLSNKYQIFAISHQPQLTSKAHKHFFVGKVDGKSFVRELDTKERVMEIARMISGKELTDKAINYAKELLDKR
ncbi:MAG: AAA family ATPase [Epsilonproteobacteria bacterium]|nr:AAA family ATPase [Campylobacterota bacterium]